MVHRRAWLQRDGDRRGGKLGEGHLAVAAGALGVGPGERQAGGGGDPLVREAVEDGEPQNALLLGGELFDGADCDGGVFATFEGSGGGSGLGGFIEGGAVYLAEAEGLPLAARR